MEPILIDTNLLVYIFDRRDFHRQEVAKRVIKALAKSSIGRLSAQCLAEFFNAVTKQKGSQSKILSVADAIQATEELAYTFTVYPVTQQVVLEALRCTRQYHLQFWDAQIWAVSHLHQIPIIFSEDCPVAKPLEGVRYVNPFASDFHLHDYLRME